MAWRAMEVPNVNKIKSTDVASVNDWSYLKADLPSTAMVFVAWQKKDWRPKGIQNAWFKHKW